MDWLLVPKQQQAPMSDANTAQKLSLPSQEKSSTIPPASSAPSKSEGSDVFAYEPIQDEGIIRLLKLSPNPNGDPHFPVSCTLVEAKLSEKPLYTAVSYTWDDTAPMSKMRLNDKTFPLRQNVLDLLRLLRKSDRPRTLWIDSICIDQKNEQERSSQVRLMADIFAGAIYVAAWLARSQAYVWKSDKDALEILKSELEGANYIGEYSNVGEMSRWFFTHRFWTRRWIVQEILLARSVVLVSEKAEVPLTGFNEALQNLQEHHGRYISSLNSKVREQALSSRYLRLFLPESRQQSPGNRTLADLLYEYRDCDCSEFVDRVYALISLSKNAVQHLKVDYGISRQSLLISVLDFSADREGLGSIELLGLISLLKEQLSITEEELLQVYLKRAKYGFLRFGHQTLGSAKMFLRGTVAPSTALPARMEAVSLFYRPVLSPLKKLGSYGFDAGLTSASPRIISPDKANSTSEVPECVSGHDLFTFALDFGGGIPGLGFSSSVLESGDELYQFRRTPVALCVRGRCRIVGRAYILARSFLSDQHSPDQLPKLKRDEMLDVFDVRHTETWRESIQIGVHNLMDLMKWVNLDD